MDIKVRGVGDRKKKYIISKVIKYVKILRFMKYTKDITLDIRVLKKSCWLDSKKDDAVFLVHFSKRTNSPLVKEHMIIINHKTLENRREFLTSLFHELVHLKQYLTKKLIYLKTTSCSNEIAVWKKEKLGSISSINYWVQPWEVEARSLTSKCWKEKKL